MRLLRRLLWPLGALLGIAGEAALYGVADPRHWVPDLAAGWTLIACGLIGSSRRADSRSGPLMTATGGAWFVGNFFSQALYLHRGPLIQLVLSYPSGRARGRLERGAIAAAYGAAVVTAVWRNDYATIVLSSLLVAVAGHGYATATGRERRARALALAASASLVVVLAGGAAVRLAFPTASAASATLLAYQLALVLLSVGLLAGLSLRPWERAPVTDLVVELGDARPGVLRDALARALRDPTLEIGFPMPDTEEFVDASGRAVDMPVAGSARRATRIERDGRTVALVVHDRAVLDDPELTEALDAAARLATSNAQLQAQVRAQVAEVRESRRRLLRAGDEERGRLERRLHEGAERRLAELGGALGAAEGDHGKGLSYSTLARVEHAQDQLVGTLAELHELATGLHPRTLADDGLGHAVRALVERSPATVEVSLPERRFSAEIEGAAYFVCSEALANVAKYAPASRVAVGVRLRDGRVCMEIADDGPGGADAARGSGLRGLADRVEALGGTLAVSSPPGRGTTVVAELPLPASS